MRNGDQCSRTPTRCLSGTRGLAPFLVSIRTGPLVLSNPTVKATRIRPSRAAVKSSRRPLRGDLEIGIPILYPPFPPTSLVYLRELPKSVNRVPRPSFHPLPIVHRHQLRHPALHVDKGLEGSCECSGSIEMLLSHDLFASHRPPISDDPMFTPASAPHVSNPLFILLSCRIDHVFIIFFCIVMPLVTVPA